MARWYPRLLRTRLVIAFLLVGVAPLLLLAAFFKSFSIDFVTRLYNERAEQQIEVIASDLERVLLRYRHVAYVVARDPLLAEVLTRSAELDRSAALELYPRLYRAIAGTLDGAALHVASLTTTPSVSTHQFPAVYRPVTRREGIYRAAGATPQRTVLFTHAYLNHKGETVNFSLAKVIHDDSDRAVGYVIIDLFKSYLAEQVRTSNDRFFMDVVVADNRAYRVADMFHPENDGTFSAFPYLKRVDRSVAGAGVVGDLVVSRRPILDGELTVVGTLPTEIALAGVGRLVAVTAWIILGAAAAAVLIAVLIARHISSPIHELAAAMQRVEAGDLGTVARASRHDEIGVLFRGFNRMVGEIRELLDRTVAEQEALRQAELRSLQAQIDPHFLYNTLGTVKSIAKLRRVPEIVLITTELGRLLRARMSSASTTTTVTESLSLVESFMRIHEQRRPGHYALRIDVEEGVGELVIPALTLQPIVENAVVHGLEPKVEPGTLTITGRIENGEALIEVTDDGVGFDPARQDGSREHIGIGNVERRLKLMFGPGARLGLESRRGHGCRVTLRIPRVPTEVAS